MSLGVLSRIKNNSFRKSVSFDTVLADTISTTEISGGISSITATSVTPTLLSTLGRNDKVKIGPSSNSSNLYATEEKIVDTGCISDDGTSSAIDFTENLLFAYNTGDPVSGVGNYFPDSWTAETYTNINSFNGDIYWHPRLQGLNLPISDRDTSDLRTFTTYGVDDFYCLKYFVEPTTNPIQLRTIAKYDFSVGDLLASTYYRLGCFYRYKVTDFAPGVVRVRLDAYDGSSTIMEDNWILTATSNIEKSSWIHSVSVTTKTASSLTSAGNITFYDDSYGLHKLMLNLDAVYMEHARLTDDEANAVYKFTELPAFGTSTWIPKDFTQKNLLLGGTESHIQQDDRKNVRWTFNCRFENCSTDFWKNLQILSMWQKLGYSLSLHTAEHWGSSPFRTPPVIFGKMKITNINKSSWDRSKKSFTFTFLEI